MKQHTFTGWIIMAFLCAVSFAADPMEERAAQLAAALNILMNSQANLSKSWVVFSSKQTVNAGKFQFKQKGAKAPTPTATIDVDVLDANDDVVATGRIIECDSFGMACNALLKKLVLNSMMIESLVQKLEVSHNDVGNLCIIEKSFDKTTRKYSSVPAVIHFVRGSTVVCLRSPAPSKNIHDIAKALDAVLSDSCAEK